jgi:hypothetical protein
VSNGAQTPGNAVVRGMLASGELGSHRGLPIADVIRLARHAHHYLTIFDEAGRPLWLGDTKRLASPQQRIVLHAQDRLGGILVA